MAKSRKPRKAQVPVTPGEVTAAADALIGRDPFALTWGLRDARQIAFIRHYLISRSGTRAALAAGYSPSNAQFYAHRLLKRPRIAQIIAAEDARLAERFKITRERILEEMSRMAFSTIGDILNWDERRMSFIAKQDLPERALAAIKRMAVSEGEFGRSFAVEMHDKKGALEYLGKFVGLTRANRPALPDGSEMESEGGIHIYQVARFELPDNGRWPAMSVAADGNGSAGE